MIPSSAFCLLFVPPRTIDRPVRVEEATTVATSRVEALDRGARGDSDISDDGLSGGEVAAKSYDMRWDGGATS